MKKINQSVNAKDLASKVDQSIGLFTSWYETTGGESWDPYDLWATKYGIFARSVYYRNAMLGAPFVVPVILLELLAPGAGRFWIKKKRFAMADAQLALGFNRLYKLRNRAEDLDRARELTLGLLDLSIPGYSGPAWGYPFDWQTNRGLWKEGTPFITVAPYAFEAFLALNDSTGEKRYLDTARLVGDFVLKDLPETDMGDGSSASAYSPSDNTMIINTSAYRAFVLSEFGYLFNSEEALTKAGRFIRFVLRNQRADGSWPYGIGKQDDFIDHFHTCFILKNLYKYYLRYPDPTISRAIQTGYRFYADNLFYPDGCPKPFYRSPRFETLQYDLYDYSEAILLGVLLRKEVDGAWEMSKNVCERMIEKFKTPKGYFATSFNRLGLANRVPYLRWAQSEAFQAITAMSEALSCAE